MAPRRRITSVVDQQHRLRELGRVRFGARKRPNAPGRPLEFPRISSSNRAVVEAIAEVYGGTPQQWQREEGAAPEWDVTTEGPIAVAVPPGAEPFTAAYEQWAKGFLTVRCDGAMCQYRARGRWVERACVCAERGQDYSERPCRRTTRFSVMILGVPILGIFRVDTKSFHAGETVPTTLALLQESGRAAWMQMRQQSDRVMVWDDKKGEDVPTPRRFWVITLDAPFMPDEVVRIHRPPSMAALPAPTTPALTRGERPQLGAGTIEPQGPQVGDREPPPREPAPVDLDPAPAAADDPNERAADEAAAIAFGEQETFLPADARAQDPDAA